MTNFKLTYDWEKIPLDLEWKFSVYDISMKLPIDYSMHLRDKDFRSGKWSFSEKDLMELVLRMSYEEEPKTVCDIMQTAMWKTGFQQNQMYSKYVLNNKKRGHEVPSMITFELGPFVWVIFNMHGAWPAIHRKTDLDERNYLTYNHKDADVFVWDNFHGMIRGDY